MPWGEEPRPAGERDRAVILLRKAAASALARLREIESDMAEMAGEQPAPATPEARAMLLVRLDDIARDAIAVDAMTIREAIALLRAQDAP